jgi:hypothetical protein
MFVEALEVTELDKRSEGRANVFLSAALADGAAVTAVRIRNISPHGALVEAPTLPAVGTKVRLLRGQLSASGELARAGAGQAGITFSGSVNVAKWIKRLDDSAQQRVDGMIAALRSTGSVPAELLETSEQSIGAISMAIDQICERLSSIPNMSLELSEELVRLDTLAQALRRLAGRPL